MKERRGRCLGRGDRWRRLISGGDISGRGIRGGRGLGGRGRAAAVVHGRCLGLLGIVGRGDLARNHVRDRARRSLGRGRSCFHALGRVPATR